MRPWRRSVRRIPIRGASSPASEAMMLETAAVKPGRTRRRTPVAWADGRLLSAQAAAAYLGVPYTSLRDWALRGHIPIVRPPECRRLWFDRRDLDRLIEQCKE